MRKYNEANDLENIRSRQSCLNIGPHFLGSTLSKKKDFQHIQERKKLVPNHGTVKHQSEISFFMLPVVDPLELRAMCLFFSMSVIFINASFRTKELSLLTVGISRSRIMLLLGKESGTISCNQVDAKLTEVNFIP